MTLSSREASALAAPHDQGCPSDETLAAEIDGRLGSEDVRRLHEHLGSCASCREVYAGTRGDRRGEGLRRAGRALRRGGRRLLAVAQLTLKRLLERPREPTA